MIGARTFGKGSVQSIIDLPGGGGLRLTTMRYYTPAGRAIQVDGILPDIGVDSSLTEDGTITVLREHDLENHLASEGAAGPTPAGPESAAAPATGSNEDPGISPTHLGVARSVPHDPSTGPDRGLSTAYLFLRDKLGARSAPAGKP